MCTVSVIPIEGGVRLVSNRDEGRRRASALAPEDRQTPRGRAVWPTDPEGGGTWIAAADHGLVLTLLNGNPAVPLDRTGLDLVSRGVIIPALIGEASAREAIAGLASDAVGQPLERFAHFRLVAADASGGLYDARWDRESLRVTEHAEPIAAFASSGLGDGEVEVRIPLFDELVRHEPTPEAQDRYHRHVWPGREPVSVMMSREAARTVSVTVCEVRTHTPGRLVYEPIDHA
ncbi:MAG: NRDE family protein [Planctomycetota bacterium]